MGPAAWLPCLWSREPPPLSPTPRAQITTVINRKLLQPSTKIAGDPHRHGGSHHGVVAVLPPLADVAGALLPLPRPPAVSVTGAPPVHLPPPLTVPASICSFDPFPSCVYVCPGGWGVFPIHHLASIYQVNVCKIWRSHPLLPQD